MLCPSHRVDARRSLLIYVQYTTRKNQSGQDGGFYPTDEGARNREAGVPAAHRQNIEHIGVNVFYRKL
jgi:hypothetical protein